MPKHQAAGSSEKKNFPRILLREFHSTARDKNEEPKQNSVTPNKILGNYEQLPFEKKNRQDL